MPLRFCLTALLFAAFVFALTGCDKQLEVRETDKALFVRAADLAEYGYKVPQPEQYEKITRSRSFDGSYDLEYEFEPSEEVMKTDPLYLMNTISIARNESDAKVFLGTFKTVMLTMLKAAGGISEEHKPGFYQYGDSSDFYILKNKDGQPVGNCFMVREGSKVYALVMSGVYFDNPATWREVVEPKLRQFSAYKAE